MVTEVTTRHKNLARQMSEMHGSGTPMKDFLRRHLAAFVAVLVLSGTAYANSATVEKKGPVTNLPLPRYVSMKAAEGNVRRGPSLTHRIDWVFTRRDMPLRIVAEHGHWRRVEDRDGMGGWVHYSLLSGVRTVIVEEDMLQIYARPDPSSPVSAALEKDVIARLGKCDKNWCQLRSGGYRGWARKDTLWGVSAAELRD